MPVRLGQTNKQRRLGLHVHILLGGGNKYNTELKEKNTLKATFILYNLHAIQCSSTIDKCYEHPISTVGLTSVHTVRPNTAAQI